MISWFIEAMYYPVSADPGSLSIEDYIGKGGYEGLTKAFDMGPAKVIEEMKKARVKIHIVYSPMARHEIQEALGLKPSPVRFFTLLGAVLGFDAANLRAGLGSVQRCERNLQVGAA